MKEAPASRQSAGGPPRSAPLAEGLALRQRRRLKQAAACFEQAVAADPSSVDGWFWLAVTRDNRGQEAEAIPAYRRALSLGISVVNQRAQAWAWLASSLSKTGRYREALSALTEADNLGGYQPAAEYQALRAQIQRRTRRVYAQIRAISSAPVSTLAATGVRNRVDTVASAAGSAR
jgi:tetratricopeptide (TPR) repeat protein